MLKIINKLHLVELSTIPILITLILYIIILDMILLIDNNILTYNIIYIDLICLIYILYLYLIDIIYDSNLKGISLSNDINNWYGFIWFIISELILFISLFITYIYIKYSNNNIFNILDLNNNMYSKISISLTNLYILFISGIVITIAQLDSSYNNLYYIYKYNINLSILKYIIICYIMIYQ